ncbi:MAG: HD domain-containing protein [Candidatus Hermodarchaeota archaeon]
MGEKKNSGKSLMEFIDSHQQDKSISDDIFINKDITRLVAIPLYDFNFFFDIAELDDITRNELSTILNEARLLPAALGNYHGAYPGGLYDHTLLVVNYTHYIWKSLHDQSWLKKVILTAICHDFGKIPYYGAKLSLKNTKIEVPFNGAELVRLEIGKKFGLTGKDRHVENAIAVIKKYLSEYDLLFDNEMYIGLIFHHGSWSKYNPQEINELAAVIHVADMIASQILKI